VILLDTSVLSRVFRRRRMGVEELRLQEVVEELMAGDVPLGLPGMVLQEVLSGVRAEKEFADLERRLLASFTILNPDTRDHVEAARLRNRCLAAGLTVSGPDCLIAALAIAGSHELFAMDDDFRALARHAPLKLFRARGVGPRSG
jgi:predicted nucleic acid-binding protein